MIGYSSNIRSTVVTLTKDFFENATHSTIVNEACATIADALEAVKRGEMSREDFNTLKNQQKKRLPIITPHATFKDGHRVNAQAEPSGFVMLDIDHVTDPEGLWKAKSEELRAKSPAALESIVLAHVTPSGEGLRLIFKQPSGLSIEQAQRAMAGKLGTEYDPSTKDLARASFLVPWDYVLFVSDDLFKEPAKTPLFFSTEETRPADAQPVKTELMFKGIKYSDIIAAWWAKDGGEPHEGERNVKLFQLASALRAITDNNADTLLAILPTYGLGENEMRALVASAVKDTPKGICKTLSEILKELSDAKQTDDEPIEAEADRFSSFPKDLAKRLPAALRATLVGIPENMQWPVLASVMPLAATYADGVSAAYCDGNIQRLGLMTIVVGDQASGKSVCSKAIALWKKTLDEEDLLQRLREDEWREKRKMRKANEKAPEDPHVLIRVLPITVSNSTLLKRLKNAQGHTLFSYGEELDTLRKSNGAGAWSSKYDVYRLAFDHGEWGQDYNSDQAESGLVKVAYNWTVLGTYGALAKCFNKENIENGLSSRIIIGTMPDSVFAPMPRYGERSFEDESTILNGVKLLKKAHGLIDVPKIRKAIGDWVEQKRIAAAKADDYAADVYRKRAAVIGFRCGVVCHILANTKAETATSVEFAVSMAEYVFRGQLRVFAELLNDNIKNHRSRQRSSNVFDILPDVFSTDDVKSAKGNGTTDNNVRVIIFRWIKAGLCKKIADHKWEKRKLLQTSR